MNALIRSALLLFGMLSCVGAVSAQDQRFYVGGEIEMSSFGTHSWDGSPSLTYNNATDGAPTIGITAEGGFFLSRNTAVGAEVNFPLGRSDVTQTHGYFNPYNRLSQYQEVSIFGMFHRYLSTSRRLRAGVAAGAGVVFESSLDRVSTCVDYPPFSCGPFSAEQETTRSALAVTVGGDAVIQVTRRLSLVPQFRVIWVRRGDPGSSFDDLVTLGIDELAFQLLQGEMAAVLLADVLVELRRQERVLGRLGPQFPHGDTGLGQRLAFGTWIEIGVDAT